MNGDYCDGSSNKDGEEGLQLKIPRLMLNQREKRDEKKGEASQEIFVALTALMRLIRQGKEIEG